MQINEIAGDAAIGRHLTLGGDAIVRGNASIGHNLRVEGWLDAPNIVDPCKGLFVSAEALFAAYPRPVAGWWAYVGSTLPASIYRAEGGQWTDSGEIGGEGMIDNRTLDSELAALNDAKNQQLLAITEAQARITALEQAKVHTECEPRQGGEDAFSTGGAFEALITDFSESVTDDGLTRLYQAVNAAGHPIGDPLQVPVYGGSGAGGDGEVSAFAIAFEKSPVYASLGSEMTLKMAARSYSIIDGVQIQNNIARIEVLDAATRNNLMVLSLANEASSVAMDDFKFEIPLGGFFQSAGAKAFVISVTDQQGLVRTKSVQAVAVDLEVTAPCPLSLCRVEMGQGLTSVPGFYRFPNNASVQGIEARVELLRSGQWHELGRETVGKTFPVDLIINPSDPLGDGHPLAEGAHLLRISGYDPVAKVSGPSLYATLACVPPDFTEAIPMMRMAECAMLDDNGRVPVPLGSAIEIEAGAVLPEGVNTMPIGAIEVGGAEVATFQPLDTDSVLLSVPMRGLEIGSDAPVTLVLGASDNMAATPALPVVVGNALVDAKIKDGCALEMDFTIDSTAGAELESVAYAPFGSQDIEISGAAVQVSFVTADIIDPDMPLLSCKGDSGAGFQIRGNSIEISIAGGVPIQTATCQFSCGQVVDALIVAEPASMAVTRAGAQYSFLKLYVGGELCGVVGYAVGQGALQSAAEIAIDRSMGSLQLRSLRAWCTAMDARQAMECAVALESDPELQAAKDAERASVGISGLPSIDSMLDLGMPCYAVVASQTVQQAFDNGTSTSEDFRCTLYYVNPQYPCLSFRADDVKWRRQGTTSAKRPVKNDRFYLSTASALTLLSPDADSELGRRAIALAAVGKVIVAPDGVPVDTVTCKVDYSDSSGARDSGACSLMSDLFQAMPPEYRTPAQRACTGQFGDFADCRLDHSTKGHPIAAFRATRSDLSDARFHAKANWKEDKAQQVALGFRDTPGYSLGCLNHGDFVERIIPDGYSTPQEYIDSEQFQLDSEAWPRDKPVLLSLYCGQDYRFVRYTSGGWQATGGSMMQRADGTWEVTGDVLCPVEGYELLAYQGMCWWRGVGSVEDMMRPVTAKSAWVQKLVDSGKVSAQEFPAWTQYFECMIDDSQLAVDLAMGHKVPYRLYRFLRFMSDVAPEVDGWTQQWQQRLCEYASVESVFAYALFTDYLAAVDQRAKNMQPMWFLEDGSSVVDGHYSSESAVRMYLNKIYDCDTCMGADNEGGLTVDPEVDPDLAEPGSPYAGYGSALFQAIARCQQACPAAGRAPLSLATVAAAMRSASWAGLRPFSPEGVRKHFITDRIARWPRPVSTADGVQKYLQSATRADQLYFGVLHGLGQLSLEAFAEARFRVRDGYYRTGLFFTGVLSGRIACTPEATITVTAARDGWYGMGHDASGQIDEAVYLKRGESHVFSQFSHVEGALLYIYQADRMESIDLSQVSLDSSFDFSVMTLASSVIIGRDGAPAWLPIGSYKPLAAISLGALPFLKTLSLRGRPIVSLDVSLCRRLTSIDASGTALRVISLPAGSALCHLALPATVMQLSLVEHNSLSYPGGLVFDTAPSFTQLRVENSPLVSPGMLLPHVAAGGAVRWTGLETEASSQVLQGMIDSGIRGIDAAGRVIDTAQCGALLGRWSLTDIPQSLEGLVAYFPGLTIDTVPCSGYAINPEDPSPDVVPLGTMVHFERFRLGMVPAVCSLNAQGVMCCQRLSETNYAQMSDGSPSEQVEGNFMVIFPKCYYCGTTDEAGRKLFWLSVRETAPDDGKPWVESPAFMVGIYQASGPDDSMVSRPGDMAGSYTHSHAYLQARTLGQGYQLVDWGMHCLLAQVWYGMSLTRDVQAVCGQGKSDEFELNGTMDSLGVADSDALDSPVGVKCLGLENFYGAGDEIMEGILTSADSFEGLNDPDNILQYSNGENNVIVTDHVGEECRVYAIIAVRGNIADMLHGAHADMLPTAISAEDGQHYADVFQVSLSRMMIGLRGGATNSQGAGLAALNLERVNGEGRTRLAYRGNYLII